MSRRLPVYILFLQPMVCHRTNRRDIRRYFRGIGFPHHIQCVPSVYHIPMAIDEETLNIPKRNYFQIYAGYRLLTKSKIGSTRVNRETAQGNNALREQNIITRHPPVRISGPITATFRLIM